MITCLVPSVNDFLCATIIDGISQITDKFYCDHLVGNIAKKNCVPFEGILPYCKKSNLILIFSNEGYGKRKELIIKNGLVDKTVYIDGSDSPYLQDYNGIHIYSMVFKRELPVLFRFKFDSMTSLKEQLRLLIKRVMPLPLAAERAYFRFCREDVKKDINVSCLLRVFRTNSPAERQEILNFIGGLKISGTVIGPVSDGEAGTSSWDTAKDGYYKILSRSKISISCKGAGFDTGRFWEILANKCLLFSPPLMNRMPHPFKEFKHFIPYNNLNELKKWLYYYVEHDQEREEIARAGHEHLVKYHTSRARAEYLLETVNKRMRV